MLEEKIEKIFSNLPSLVYGQFRPASGPGNGWITFDYKFDDFSGIGLATGACSTAGELVLDLKIDGGHRLYIAFNPAVRIWIDGDRGYYELRGSVHNVRIIFALRPTLQAKKLHIAPVVRGSFSRKELIIFYIRVVSCEIYNSTRNLIATNDGHCLFWDDLDSSRDLYKYLLPLKNSDFFRIVWGVYGGGFLNVKDSKVADRIPWRDDACFYEKAWVF